MSDPETVRAERLAEAALQVPAARRAVFLDEACGDAVLRREVNALLARHVCLSQLPPDTRQRVSGLFHVALGLTRERRARYLDLACGEEPAVRLEVDELLACADDSGFLAVPAQLSTADETRVHVPGGASPRAGAGSDAAPPRRSDPFIGRKVREYVILEKVGEGGMGVVYRALDRKLERHVALKVIRPEYAGNAEYRKRLATEAKLAAQLSHQNIARVFAHFEDEGDLFIVSEFVDGPSLRERIEGGPLPYSDLLKVFVGVAQGLAAAHAKAIIHRDLKPDNILLTQDGEPKIVDFGLARSHRTLLQTARSTGTGTPGTPAYMAPEQTEVHAGQRIDFRADIFAFGVTLYEAIDGRNPFEGRTLLTTLDNIRCLHPPAPVRPGVDLGNLAHVVLRCLGKNPEDRYNSTKDLVADLELWPPPPPPRQGSTRRWWEVHQLGTTGFYAVTLVLLWWLHRLAGPKPASLALAMLGVLVGSALGTVRMHFWFASRQGLKKLRESLARFGPWVKRGDVVLSAILFGVSSLLLYTDRPNTAVILVVFAVINLGLAFIIEPAAKADAFPEDDDKANSPPQGPPSAPAA